MGFMGMLSSLRGAKGEVKDVRERGSHVGADEQRGHELLARVGPHAALLLVACDDHDTRTAAVAKATDQASESWDASRTEFLADLDPAPSTTGFARPSASPPARPARREKASLSNDYWVCAPRGTIRPTIVATTVTR